ncbi:beta-1,4-glucuronyltransferase 1-like [Drosophila willistoni]|uniref:beta-1,4-glucuronyltransferase 1-like n=1 Tax=Drosophila willistoni TaxID=7260 RepID=UPI001F077F64|nr:beta-1,4-glucuronyltransferase 1-like [Drosophila willistoni]
MLPYVIKSCKMFGFTFLCCVSLIILYKMYTKEDADIEVKNSGSIRQHGDYWVWNNYIRASEDLIGNESITLTSHGTYMDLRLLPKVLSRWQAPISLTIFACDEDYDNFNHAWKYLLDCHDLADLMRRYVSIHLVFHQSFVPKHLDNLKSILNHIVIESCDKSSAFLISDQSKTFWHQHKLTYPVNLLRNIARQNVNTYYILALDLQLLPPPKFARKFLKFIWNHDRWRYGDIREPYTTVFCLPTFVIKADALTPKTKFQLLMVLRDFNITTSIHDDFGGQVKWLHMPNPKDELFIFSRSKRREMCVAYISINELEPLYDENNEMESIYEESSTFKSQILIDLNYTFIVLDGAFLLRSSNDSWQHSNVIWSPRPSFMNWRRHFNWHQFYHQLMSHVPDNFAYTWYLKSRSTQYFLNREKKNRPKM